MKARKKWRLYADNNIEKEIVEYLRKRNSMYWPSRRIRNYAIMRMSFTTNRLASLTAIS